MTAKRNSMYQKLQQFLQDERNCTDVALSKTDSKPYPYLINNGSTNHKNNKRFYFSCRVSHTMPPNFNFCILFLVYSVRAHDTRHTTPTSMRKQKKTNFPFYWAENKRNLIHGFSSPLQRSLPLPLTSPTQTRPHPSQILSPPIPKS